MRRQLQSLPMDDVSIRLKQYHFQIINFGSFSLDSGMTMNKRFLSHYRIFIAVTGRFELHRNTIHYPLAEGDIVIIRPSILYSAVSGKEPSQFYYLDFMLEESEQQQQFNELFRIKDVLYQNSSLNQRQINNLYHLNNSVQAGFPGTYLLTESMLYRILIVVLKRLMEEETTFTIKNPDNAKERLLLKCCKYIDEHLDEPLTVKQLAEHFNYSENYIYKTFNETLNLSCKTYILEYRLSRSLQELKSTTLPVSEIAQRCGFSTVYHFSNAFKKKYGYSPLNYRKSMEK